MLPQIVIAANAASGRDGFEVYRQAIGTVFDASIGNWQADPHFDVRVEGVQLGSLVLSRARMINADFRYERRMSTIARTASELVLVQIILEGEDLRLVGGEWVRSRPGDVFICDMTRTLATKAENCGNFTFAFPRAALGLEQYALDGLHDLHWPAESIQARLLKAHISALWDDRDRIEIGQAGGLAETTVALLSSLANGQGGLRETRGAIAKAGLDAARAHIEAHLAEADLGPESIALALGLSRASLYRLFEPVGGVANYIRERRLRHAFRSLIAEEGRRGDLARIAHRHGFSSVAQLNRAFKALYGTTPGDLRGQAQARAAMATGEAQHDGERLVLWLAELGRY